MSSESHIRTDELFFVLQSARVKWNSTPVKARLESAFEASVAQL